MEILTFESGNRKVFFEPKDQLNTNGFIQAKDWLNSKCLKSGNFPKYAYHESLCRPANTAERDEYIALKDHSKYALNATE